MELNHDKIMERLARELGALTINNHILTLEVEQHQAKSALDDSRIEALTKRVLEQDATIKELRELTAARKTNRVKNG